MQPITISPFVIVPLGIELVALTMILIVGSNTNYYVRKV